MGVQLLTIPETAARLSVSVDTVYRLIAAGRLRAKSLGPRKTRVEEAALAAYVDSLEDVGAAIHRT